MQNESENRKVNLILDGAHTRESMFAFCEWISCLKESKNGENVLIFNCNQTKNIESLLLELIKIDKMLNFSIIVFTSNDISQNENNPHTKHPYKHSPSNPPPYSSLSTGVNWQEKMLEIWKSNSDSSQKKKFLVSPCLKHSFNFIQSNLSPSLDSNQIPNLFVTGSLYLIGSVFKYIKYNIDDL